MVRAIRGNVSQTIFVNFVSKVGLIHELQYLTSPEVSLN